MTALTPPPADDQVREAAVEAVALWIGTSTALLDPLSGPLRWHLSADGQELRDLAETLLSLPAVSALVDKARADTLRPFEDLFGSDPDTPCRTTWRESTATPECSAASTECVEVPMDDLRDAFDRAAIRQTEGNNR